MKPSRIFLLSALAAALVFTSACTKQQAPPATEQAPPAQAAESAPPPPVAAAESAAAPAQNLTPPAPAGQPVARAPQATPAARAPQTTPAVGGQAPVQKAPPPASATQSAVPDAAPPATRAAAPAPPPPPPPKEAVFAAGTAIAIRTTNTISTKTNKAGETFVGSLEEALVDGNWVVAPRGSEVTGTIVHSDQGGRVKGKAAISLALKSLKLADGRTVAISTGDFSQEAKGSEKKDALKVGIGAGVGAAIGAIAGGGRGAAIGAGVGGGAGAGSVLLTRGDAVEIPSETVLRFALTDQLVVVEKR